MDGWVPLRMACEDMCGCSRCPFGFSVPDTVVRLREAVMVQRYRIPERGECVALAIVRTRIIFWSSAGEVACCSSSKLECRK
jgi:hypothetical protein